MAQRQQRYYWANSAYDFDKARIIGESWGVELTNGHLYYYVGESPFMASFNEMAQILQKHFHGEIHPGDVQHGSCRQIKGSCSLRLTGNVRLLPHVIYRGHQLMLYQFGANKDPNHINFIELWGK